MACSCHRRRDGRLWSYLGTGEDYESGTTSYELTVRASDGGLHSDVTVTVNVTDVEPKRRRSCGDELRVLTRGERGRRRGQCSVGRGLCDGLPENSTITYSIEAGDSGGLFEIDAASGEVFYIGAGEDYESGTTSYDLTVAGELDGGLHSDVTVTVNVTDVAEAPAFFGDAATRSHSRRTRTAARPV